MRLSRAVDAEDHVRGSGKARLTLVEYGDFQCPYSGEVFHELKELELALKNELRFAFRHFPLTQLHPLAMLAAEAAEAAGAQGKFWQMHQTLYTHPHQLEAPALIGYAAKLELELRKFSLDLQLHRHRPKIRRQFLEGVRSGANGTPTFFINGYRYSGPHTAPALLAGLRQAARAAA